MKMNAQDEKWQAEDDMRTLARAEEIKKDPARLKACREMAKHMMDAMGMKEMQQKKGKK